MKFRNTLLLALCAGPGTITNTTRASESQVRRNFRQVELPPVVTEK